MKSDQCPLGETKPPLELLISKTAFIFDMVQASQLPVLNDNKSISALNLINAARTMGFTA